MRFRQVYKPVIVICFFTMIVILMAESHSDKAKIRLSFFSFINTGYHKTSFSMLEIWGHWSYSNLPRRISSNHISQAFTINTVAPSFGGEHSTARLTRKMHNFNLPVKIRRLIERHTNGGITIQLSSDTTENSPLISLGYNCNSGIRRLVRNSQTYLLLLI